VVAKIYHSLAFRVEALGARACGSEVFSQAGLYVQLSSQFDLFSELKAGREAVTKSWWMLFLWWSPVKLSVKMFVGQVSQGVNSTALKPTY